MGTCKHNQSTEGKGKSHGFHTNWKLERCQGIFINVS